MLPEQWFTIVVVFVFAHRFTGLVKTFPIPPVNAFFRCPERLAANVTELRRGDTRRYDLLKTIGVGI